MKKIYLFIVFVCVFSFPIITKAIDITTTIKEENNTCIKDCEEKTLKENDTEKQDDILTDGKSAVLIESSSGKIIYEKNSHERYAPASMTKIMTT